jgi:hypothetical protein
MPYSGGVGNAQRPVGCNSRGHLSGLGSPKGMLPPAAGPQGGASGRGRRRDRRFERERNGRRRAQARSNGKGHKKEKAGKGGGCGRRHQAVRGWFNNGWKGRSARSHTMTDSPHLRASVLSNPLVVRCHGRNHKNLPVKAKPSATSQTTAPTNHDTTVGTNRTQIARHKLSTSRQPIM